MHSGYSSQPSVQCKLINANRAPRSERTSRLLPRRSCNFSGRPLGSVDLVTLDCGGCLRRPVSVYLPAYPGFDSIAKIEYCTLAQLFYKLTFRPSGQQLHPAKGEAPSLFVLYIRVCAAMSALHICHTSQLLGDGSPPQTLNSESPETPKAIGDPTSSLRVSRVKLQRAIWNT